MISINVPKETLKYVGAVAVVFGAWLGAYVWGIHLGATQAEGRHADELAALTVELDQKNGDLISSQIALAACKAKSAGECALDCESLIQERVSHALSSCAELCKD
ncbi:hypothetical protein [uncultured Idiomarina sp.]|uniref:hypothetical protein n=1 Tax=uncultured Idiomarina sp. TaxID=352961 RepID=UPI0032B28DE7